MMMMEMEIISMKYYFFDCSYEYGSYRASSMRFLHTNDLCNRFYIENVVSFSLTMLISLDFD